MLTLNETFAVPDADRAWGLINDLGALVECVPGARVKTVEGAHAVKAEIQVRMGAMGMTFTGRVEITSSDAASRTVAIAANTREALGQSYATGDITICLGHGDGTIAAIANVGGKAAGMGEGVIVNVLTDLVRGFSANVEQRAGDASAGSPAPAERIEAAQPAQPSTVDRPPATVAQAATPRDGQGPKAIFTAVTRSFGGRLDVKQTTGLDHAPLLKASGQSFAMLHGDELVVRLHPLRCADLIEAGKGRQFVHDGHAHSEWLVVNGLDAAQWTAHTMEALACARD